MFFQDFVEVGLKNGLTLPAENRVGFRDEYIDVDEHIKDRSVLVFFTLTLSVF